MTTPIRIIINGATGQMGQETIRALSTQHDIAIVGKLTRKDALAKAIEESNAQVVIDFTTPDCVFENAKTIIKHHAHPIIGTTGLTHNQIETLSTMCENAQLGGIIAPNFSIGVLLLMKFAQQAASYFPDCEIIEMHHNNKKDAPSGTALKTAELINLKKQTNDSSIEKIAGARGALHEHIRIHSIRLPGLLAHEEVLFSGHHELLTLRHDTYNRAAFMPGVLLAIRKVLSLSSLVYGLENLL